MDASTVSAATARTAIVHRAIAGHRSVFRAAVKAMVAVDGPIAEDVWAAIESIASTALSGRPHRMQRQFGLLLTVIDGLARIRHGRRFAALPDARRSNLLGALERAPLLLLRRGVWGLRTIAFMGWYGRAEAAARIGYSATPDGWEARARDSRASMADDVGVREGP